MDVMRWHEHMRRDDMSTSNQPFDERGLVTSPHLYSKVLFTRGIDARACRRFSSSAAAFLTSSVDSTPLPSSTSSNSRLVGARWQDKSESTAPSSTFPYSPRPLTPPRRCSPPGTPRGVTQCAMAARHKSAIRSCLLIVVEGCSGTEKKLL